MLLETVITCVKMDAEIFNHEKPSLQKQQYISISSQMRKKYNFYKKAFSNFSDFAATVEEVVEIGRKRSMRGIDPTDSSKDDSDEEMMNNLTLHTTNGDQYVNKKTKLTI
jgi:hypothetical protein